MFTLPRADVYTDLNGLTELKNQARNQSPEALKETARQFESIFLGMVLKSMREANLGEGLLDSDKTKFYQSMYDQQLSLHLAGQSGIGLADLIVKQLGGNEEHARLENRNLEDYRESSLPVAKVRRIKDAPVESGQRVENKLKIRQEGPIKTIGQFLNQLWTYAEEAGRKIGVDPKILLAQSALETGWGRAVIERNGANSHNLFNIKADESWSGKKVRLTALEYEQGIAVKKSEGFRVYDSYRESFQDYVDFIQRNPRYQEALQKAGNPENYIRALQEAGYATDPGYADKVMAIFHGKALGEFREDGLTAMNQ
ncbi:MAG: flagellar assembly peptidoglycan hydrolase FlgJ [Gammaproteobacteria bacterium]